MAGIPRILGLNASQLAYHDFHRLHELEQENSMLRGQVLIINGACKQKIEATERTVAALVKMVQATDKSQEIHPNADRDVATIAVAMRSIQVPPLAQLSRAQCPENTYYEQSEWFAAKKSHAGRIGEPGKRGRSYLAQNVNATMLYVTDVNGQPVDGQRVGNIRENFRALMRQLFLLKILAPKWGQLPFAARQFICYHMSQLFPELSWCRGNWKTEQIASETYSHFARELLRDAGEMSTSKSSEKVRLSAAPADHDIEEIPPSDPPDGLGDADAHSEHSETSGHHAITSCLDAQQDREGSLSPPSKRNAGDASHGQPKAKRLRANSNRRRTPSAVPVLTIQLSSPSSPERIQDRPHRQDRTTSPMRSASRTTLTSIATTMLDLRFATPDSTTSIALSALNPSGDPASAPQATVIIASPHSPERYMLTRSRSSLRALPALAARKKVALARGAQDKSAASRCLDDNASIAKTQNNGPFVDHKNIYAVRLGSRGVGWRSIVGLDFMRQHKNGTVHQFNAHVATLTKEDIAEAKRRASGMVHRVFLFVPVFDLLNYSVAPK
ncbi:hypothetical protein HDZ31DRAFT_33649 [Schizophyllum fasciatum]